MREPNRSGEGEPAAKKDADGNTAGKSWNAAKSSGKAGNGTAKQSSNTDGFNRCHPRKWPGHHATEFPKLSACGGRGIRTAFIQTETTGGNACGTITDIFDTARAPAKCEFAAEETELSSTDKIVVSRVQVVELL